MIVGGESVRSAAVYVLAWARRVLADCRKAKTPFFLKQLGTNPVEDGKPLPPVDKHGGDWCEWPDDLRHRDTPHFHDWLAHNGEHPEQRHRAPPRARLKKTHYATRGRKRSTNS